MITNYFDILTSIRFQIAFSLILLSLSSAVMGREIEATSQNWKNTRTLESASNGLIYSLPEIDQTALQSEVKELSHQLQQRQEELNKFISDNKFSASDAVIIAALPGGLIYAAFKKQKSVTAQKNLDYVRSQLDSLKYDPIAKQQYLQKNLLASR
ncbi:MAG: hypothetical protein OQL10_08520 [Sedimenticola sp.]|uniref:Uncharacterized protein n=1 Tax=Sedimenticola thiotaurini TaxID=1543721 RepID=A0A558CVA8_9GAMM|nr:hypothetical protein [Sedimenticola sp.]TVT52675.1 MAG: hypothetical protein FHK82_13200 [Sedimenticola thiotaurini]